MTKTKASLKSLRSGKQRKRRKSKAEAACLNTKGKTKCEVCIRLLDLFLGKSKTNQIELGDLQEVISPPNCDAHRKLFVEHLGLDLNVKNVLARRDSSVLPVIDLEWQEVGTVLAESRHSVSSKGWALSSRFAPKQREGRISIVDPQWIDSNRIRRWKERCDGQHTERCRDAYRIPSLIDTRPHLLIDCWRNCLVVTKNSDSYVALSYVWGGVHSYETTNRNLQDLQIPGALSSSSVKSKISPTIQHAISLTTLLRERYLWVDSLCIIQDDPNAKQQEIQKMGGIFTNATLTIIVRYENAGHGIPGIRGVSTPRDYQQQLFEVGKGQLMAQTFWSKFTYEDPTWSTRAWTFQEGLFSSRRLTFQNNSVFWDCYCSGRWFEDFESTSRDFEYAEERTWREGFQEYFPDMRLLGGMIQAYNDRRLTYPEDILDAFTGILSGLRASFWGGFIFGLPIMNLDMGLLWQPMFDVTWRKSHDNNEISFPSWSWVAWQGPMDKWSWYKTNDHVKMTRRGSALLGAQTAERVRPIVKWFVYHEDENKNLIRTEAPNVWLQHREKYLFTDETTPPKGWTRFVNDYYSLNGGYYLPEEGRKPRWFYKHESDPDFEFWYPVPLASEELSQPTINYLPVISCHTQRTRFYGAEQITHRQPTIALRDLNGLWAGCLQLHERLTESTDDNDGDGEKGARPRNHNFAGVAFELAAISLGHNYENTPVGGSMTEWHYEGRSRDPGGVYNFYNVLWIKWENGLARRQGIGRVEKGIWEAQDRESFHLILV